MPAKTTDEHGCDNEKIEHRVLDGERTRDEWTSDIRGAWIEAFGRGHIRESEERPLYPSHEIIDSELIKTKNLDSNVFHHCMLCFNAASNLEIISAKMRLLEPNGT